MESFFLSPKMEQRRTYRTRDQAKAHVLDYIERFYNPKCPRSIACLSPMEFEMRTRLA